MPQENIIDTMKPNSGRIYDYMLGGHHNFEVDRQAAEQLMRIVPSLPKVMRLQRWCLQDVAVELTKNLGFDVIIDFASGLPTNDHFHSVAPQGATIIYSDYDPVVVEYAKEILTGVSNVYYFQADARRPDELLSRPEVKAILGKRREVGLVYWGVSLFLSDDDIAYAAQYLHEWAGDKSVLAFNAQGTDVNVDANDPKAAAGLEIYRRAGTPVHLRSLEQLQKLLQPWKPKGKGFMSLLEWHGFDASTLSDEDRQVYGSSGGNYGAYLVK
jgi:hypothetical protein